MMVQENVHAIFKPDEQEVRKHIQLIAEGMEDYEDGRIEISYGNHNNEPCLAQSFEISDLDAAVKFACERNTEGRNVYVVGALLNPESKSDSRSSDSDFYASSVVWVDIDSAVNPAELKKKYESLPPTMIVVTGREPNIRTHLWWKLEEPTTDADELREVLEGLQLTLGGDPMVKNPTSLMRLGGTVNWQTEKKKSKGRRVEMTEVKTPGNATSKTYIDALFQKYGNPAVAVHAEWSPPPAVVQSSPSTFKDRLNLIEVKDDGREKYMHDMLCATIIHLTAQLGRWPTQEEVFADAWPVYSSKVLPTMGKTLDQEGRGARVMRSKIKSKLGAFARGRIRGNEDVEAIVRNNPVDTQQVTSPSLSSRSVVESANATTAQQNNALASFKLTDWVASDKYQGVAKPIRWLVEGLFPLGVPCLLAAMGGLGKSFIALDMAIRIAMPRNPLNIGGEPKALGHNIMESGKVVMLTAEDSFDSIHRRINRLVDPSQLTLTSKNLIIIPMSSVDFPQLLVREGRNGLEMTELFEEIKRQLMEIPDLKLVCIDPLQAFVGADITSKPEAAQFMWSAFAKIAAQCNATFLATHHMRKDGMGEIRTAADAREGIRGTTGLVDGARVAFVLWQVVKEIGESIARTINEPYEAHRYIQGAVVKANDEADHNVMTFHRQETGVLKCFGVVDTSDAAKKAGILNDNQDFVLRAIRNCLDEKGRNVFLGNGRGNVWAISYNDLKGMLDRMGYRKIVERENDTSADVADRVRSSTYNARVSLERKGYIGCGENWIWSIKSEGATTIAEKARDQEFDLRLTDERFENEFN